MRGHDPAESASRFTFWEGKTRPSSSAQDAAPCQFLLLPAGKRRHRLENWFNEGVNRITCLGWDAAVGLRWAKLLADLRHRGEASLTMGDAQCLRFRKGGREDYQSLCLTVTTSMEQRSASCLKANCSVAREARGRRAAE